MNTIRIDHVQPLNNNFIQCMNQDIRYVAEGGLTFDINVADECPLCHYAFDMSNDKWRNFHDISSKMQEEFNIIAVHICPHCHEGFVIMHHMKIHKDKIVETSQSVYPIATNDLQIDKDIQQISPRFYKIYNQCLIAKNDGLDQIYGMGLRKALEMLVTDFAIKQNPNERNKILKMTLHKRIETYFKNSDEKTALMACKSLGNNEVHYENRNTDDDLQLFEYLIEDTLYYIHREIRQKKAENIIDAKGIV